MGNATGFFMSMRDEGKTLMRILVRKGPQTKAQLIDLTNMKLSTLNRIMKPLEDAGLVEECSVGKSTGGRRPTLYGIRPGRFYMVGVDLSRTRTQVILANLKMDILDRRIWPMGSECTPDRVVCRIGEWLRGAEERLSVSRSDILGVGAGVVGPLSREDGLLVDSVLFPAPGWRHAPVKGILEGELGLPVTVDNGANMAALAEGLLGAGKGMSPIAYVSCGVGIRTGAISAGEFVGIINEQEDALGHMVVDFDGPPCRCGSFGCVESYASIAAISDRFAAHMKKVLPSAVVNTAEEISYRDICAYAEEGDESASEAITGAATALGTGLSNFIRLMGPRMVILGGPLIDHSSLFYRTCTDAAQKGCASGKSGPVRFSTGAFGELSIAIGAAAYVLERALEPNKSREV